MPDNLGTIIWTLCYTAVLLGISLYGLHRYLIVYLFLKNRRNAPVPFAKLDKLPRVTVQLPIFNELYVVERLLDSVSKLDYPRDLLDVQVLDDSTDETRELATKLVGALHARGYDITHIHRTDRTGFKAGALENGLLSAKGEFILILEGMTLSSADGAGDVISLAITPGMIASSVSPSVYMISTTDGLDPYIAMIDQDYNFIKEAGSKGNYLACDNAGYSCWGESSDLSNYYVSRSGGRSVPSGPYDAMLKMPLQAGTEGNFYNFIMRSAGMKTYGDYTVAFHVGIG